MELIKESYIGRAVFINGEEGQIVAVKDGGYVIFTENNEYHIDDLNKVFCPDDTKVLPVAYTQLALIVRTLNLIVRPLPTANGKAKAAIDYNDLRKDSNIRRAVEYLSKGVQYYNSGRKSHLPQKIHDDATDTGVETLDTLSLLYFAMLTMSTKRRQEFREKIEELLWLTTQGETITNDIPQIQQIIKWNEDRGLTKYDPTLEASFILEELHELCGLNTRFKDKKAFREQMMEEAKIMTKNMPTVNTQADSFADIIVYCVGGLHKLTLENPQLGTVEEILQKVINANEAKGKKLDQHGKVEKHENFDEPQI